MIRTRVFALSALLVLAAGLLASCGDDADAGASSDADPQQVLEDTFTNDQSIESANIDLSLQAAVEGDESDSVDIRVSGPVGGNSADEVEAQLAIEGTVTSAGVDESIDAGIILTGGEGYVEYKGTTYELDQDGLDAIQSQLEGAAEAIDTADSLADPAGGEATSLEESCEQALGQLGGADTSVCDFSVYDFITNLSVEGEEDIGGVQATHVSADIDVDQIIATLAEIVAQTPASLFLGPDTLSAFSDAVSEASFDVYTGVDDQILRGLDIAITAEVPAAFASLAGFNSVTEDASLRLTEVNEPVNVEAPANPRPITDLYDELGVDPGDLEGLDLPGLGGSGTQNLELPGLGGN